MDVVGADRDELVLGRFGGAGLEVLDHGRVGERDEGELALVEVVGQAAAVALGGQGQLADDPMPVGLEDDAQVPVFHRRFVSDPPRPLPHATSTDETSASGRADEDRLGWPDPSPTSRPARSTSWDVPERYNIAADVCDKHTPRQAGDGLGALRRRHARARLGRAAGPLQPGRARAARPRGRARATGSPSSCRPLRRPPAIFFGTWKLGAILLSMSVLYGDEGIRHRLGDCRAEGAGHRRRQRRPLRPRAGRRDPGPRRRTCSTAAPPTRSARTPRPTTRPSSTTPRAPPGWRRASSTPTATSSPTRSSSTATTSSDGERFHGMGEWAWAAGHLPPARAVAARRRPVRLPARGRLRPGQAARLPLPPRGHERLHDPDRDAGDDGDRGRRRALPAEVPDRLLGRRAAQPGGDPLVPRAVRGHRARLLRADRVLPAVRELPVHGGPRGLDGPADAGLGRADPRRGREPGRPGRARRDLPARPLEPALPARLLADCRRRARRPSAASGSTPRTRRRWTRTATSGTRAAPTT